MADTRRGESDGGSASAWGVGAHADDVDQRTSGEQGARPVPGRDHRPRPCLGRAGRLVGRVAAGADDPDAALGLARGVAQRLRTARCPLAHPRRLRRWPARGRAAVVPPPPGAAHVGQRRALRRQRPRVRARPRRRGRVPARCGAAPADVPGAPGPRLAAAGGAAPGGAADDHRRGAVAGDRAAGDRRRAAGAAANLGRRQSRARSCCSARWRRASTGGSGRSSWVARSTAGSTTGRPAPRTGRRCARGRRHGGATWNSAPGSR